MRVGDLMRVTRHAQTWGRDPLAHHPPLREGAVVTVLHVFGTSDGAAPPVYVRVLHSGGVGTTWLAALEPLR